MKPLLLSLGTISMNSPRVAILDKPLTSDSTLITTSYQQIMNPADPVSLHVSHASVIIRPPMSYNVYKVSPTSRFSKKLYLYLHQVNEGVEHLVNSMIEPSPKIYRCYKFNKRSIIDVPKNAIIFSYRGEILATTTNCLGILKAKEIYHVNPFFYNILYLISDAVKTLIQHSEESYE